jgi:hypothetical protein
MAMRHFRVMVLLCLFLLLVIVGGWVGTSFAGPIQQGHLAVIARSTVSGEEELPTCPSGATCVCVVPGDYDYTANQYENSYYSEDYPSVSAAIIGEAGTLSGDLYIDIIHGDESYNWSGSPDTTAVEVDGYNCGDGAHLVTVRTLDGTEYTGATSSRPDWSGGAIDTTAYLLRSTDSSYTFLIDNDYGSGDLKIKLIGLQIQKITTAANALRMNSGADTSGITVENCWIDQNTASYGVYVLDDDVPVRFVNTVVDGHSTGSNGIVFAADFAHEIVNCDVFGWVTAGLNESISSNDIILVNSIFGNNADDISGGDYVGTNNCSDYIGDFPGSNVQPTDGADDWTGELTTPWTNITPKNSGNIYQGGVSGQDVTWGDYLPEDDINGVARPNEGTGYTIGAFEYVAP